MAKDATLESLRVTLRKVEQRFAPLEALAVRVGKIERILTQLDQRVSGLLGKAAPILALQPEPEPEPVAPPPAAAITAEDIGLALRAAVTDLGTQLSAVLRESLNPPVPRQTQPPRNGAVKPSSEDLGELGIEGGSVVAFEQTRG